MGGEAVMLSALDKCILEMNEIKELEKASNDSQKQEKIDRTFRNTVNETERVILAIQSSNQKFCFKLSAEQKEKLVTVLKNCLEAIARGDIQEATANYQLQELNRLKKAILQEWSVHFGTVTEQKVRMLQTVKGIATDKSKIDYAVNKMNSGKAWEFKQENLDMMEKGIMDADAIIQSLGLIDEVTEFFEKVVAGKANIGDLTPNIIAWIEGKNLTSKLRINFK